MSPSSPPGGSSPPPPTSPDSASSDTEKKVLQIKRLLSLLPLMDKVKDFLTGDAQVMLILGDSGAGKSTSIRHLEHEIWQEYKAGGRIPLFINLPALERPEKNLVAEQLRTHNFLEDQIRKLKKHRRFILICDGYDES
ncbi:hypothetical protein KI688_003678 [Linnemannia hyalina]|uniref:NACHT domain-containing protein n=1 Tax=Linnemannia hyalina TaxID=64524 RepID=A0A9P7XPX0_9FUNG|nr:hypothetical protein KI688_003678 [Linnemannia hyalina]